jgi:hypothetical protein
MVESHSTMVENRELGKLGKLGSLVVLFPQSGHGPRSARFALQSELGSTCPERLTFGSLSSASSFSSATNYLIAISQTDRC